jgi:hypothetical protein
VARVAIAGNQIRGRYRNDGREFRLVGPSNQGLFLDSLREKGVEVWFRDAAAADWPLQLLGTWAPLLLLGALWFFMIRQLKGRNILKPEAQSPEISGKLR